MSIKRRDFLKFIAAPAILSMPGSGHAQIAKKVTFGYLLDPGYEAVTWAMTNGRIKSDLVTVEARGLAIPQLIQATASKQFDVI